MTKSHFYSKQKVLKKIVNSLIHYQNTMNGKTDHYGIEKIVHEEVTKIAHRNAAAVDLCLKTCIDFFSHLKRLPPHKEIRVFSTIAEKWQQQTLQCLPIAKQKQYFCDLHPLFASKKNSFFSAFFSGEAIFYHKGSDQKVRGDIVKGKLVSATFSGKIHKGVFCLYDENTSSILSLLEKIHLAKEQKQPLCIITNQETMPFRISKKLHGIDYIVFFTKEMPTKHHKITFPMFFNDHHLAFSDKKAKEKNLVMGYQNANEKRFLHFLVKNHQIMKDRIVFPLDALEKVSFSHPIDQLLFDIFTKKLEEFYKIYPQFSFSKWKETLTFLTELIENLLSIEVMLRS